MWGPLILPEGTPLKNQTFFVNLEAGAGETQAGFPTARGLKAQHTRVSPEQPSTRARSLGHTAPKSETRQEKVKLVTEAPVWSPVWTEPGRKSPEKDERGRKGGFPERTRQLTSGAGVTETLRRARNPAGACPEGCTHGSSGTAPEPRPRRPTGWLYPQQLRGGFSEE